MKTKHAKKLLVLLISVMMIATLFIGMSITASAEGTGETSPPAAEISGKNVNLGGDISMKYYVKINDETVMASQLKLTVTFLGTVTELTESTYNESTQEYVFTFEGINPQCMGDEIDAVLYVGETEVDNELDYSVRENLVSIYADASKEVKQLIIDTLEYGAAAQVYRDYKTDALVTKDVSFISEGAAVVNASTSPYLYEGYTETTYLQEVTVNFSNTNLIKIKYVNNDESVTESSTAIAPYDFSTKYVFTVENGFTLEYSINDYCYEILYGEKTATYSDEMKALASALYNYGLSAHIVKGNHEGGDGTATCEHGKICSVCGEYYGETLEHSYSYTANDDANTITAACENGCGHCQTIELKAPENTVYTGNKVEATVTGADGITYDLTYDADPVGAGAYTATLTVGDKSVSVDFTIERATPTYEVPTEITATYGDTLATVNLPTGWAWKDARTTSVGNAGTRTFKAIFTPTDNLNYTTAEADVAIEVAKADIDFDTFTDPEFAEDLVYNGTAQALVTAPGSVEGGTLVYSLSPYDGYSETIPVATDADSYVVYYYIQGDENHNDYGMLGAQYDTVIIGARSGAEATVTLEYTSVQFDGTAKTPGVTSVVVDGKILNAETDYEISYENNTYVGTATVKITFKGNYAATATATFEITQDPKTQEFDGIWVVIPTK